MSSAGFLVASPLLSVSSQMSRCPRLFPMDFTEASELLAEASVLNLELRCSWP
jgi:hypothetical protein